MKYKLAVLENLINYKFDSKEIFKRSLTHKSFHEDINNEKLEFLGDRVLGLIISKNLLAKYPNEKEGIIDKKFANLVNKKRCAEISNKINLVKYMFLGNNYKKKDQKYDKISGDCLEALIGAIFTDGGLKNAEKFILRYWEDSLKYSDNTFIDSKTKLQEYSLKKFKKLPTYVLIKTSGPDHKPLFNVTAKIVDSKKISATGKSKKEAQQNAARKLLEFLKI
jgi:ribonuclease-3